MSGPPGGPASAERYSSPARAAARLLIYTPVTLVLIPVQALFVALHLDYAKRFTRLYHRQCCRLFGFDIRQRGGISAERPVLFVSNHTTYLDIPVLGALVEASFIAKAEVADWPFFGWLAKLSRTVFIDRRVRRTAAHRDEIAARLAAGDSLVLFPEGTSGDGRALLPFKSALFAVAEARDGVPPPIIQPVSITYTKLDGLPLGRALRPCLSWFGDMTLMPHLFAALGLGSVTVEVWFHPVLEPADYPSRKALADACREIIAAGVERSRSAGRHPPEPAAAAGMEGAERAEEVATS